MPNYRVSGYQYETSPRKLEPEYVPQRNPYIKKKSSTLKQTNKEKERRPQKKRKIKSHVKTVMYIGIVFSILLVSTSGYSHENSSFFLSVKPNNSRLLSESYSSYSETGIVYNASRPVSPIL